MTHCRTLLAGASGESVLRFVILALLMMLGMSTFAKDDYVPMEWGVVTDAEWQTGVPSDYPDANVVYLRRDANCLITPDVVSEQCHARLKVLNQAGVEELDEFVIQYWSGRHVLKTLKAQTIAPDGTRTKVTDVSIFERRHGKRIETVFVFSAVTPGCVLEYEYEITSEHGQYYVDWEFQKRFYTYLSRLAVDIYPGFEFAISDYNIPEEHREPKIETHADPMLSHIVGGATMRKHIWTLTNLPPIEDEPLMGAQADYEARVAFQILTYESANWGHVYQKNWKQVGKLVNRWFDRYCDDGGFIRNLADSLTAGLTADREKSRALYRFLQEKVATSNDYIDYYVSHENIRKMVEEQRGTGEEKNILLARLHEALDIKAWNVLISTRDYATFDAGNPTQYQFNYVITCVQFEDGWEFLDAANRNSPYGMLSPGCLTEGGLLIDGGKSMPIKINIRDLLSSRHDKTLVLIGDDGAVTCQTQSVSTGYEAAQGANLSSPYETDEFIEKYYLDAINVVSEPEHAQLVLDGRDQLQIAFRFRDNDLVEEFDDNLVVKPVQFMYRTNPFKRERRYTPIDFVHKRVLSSTTEFEFANGYSDAELPADTTLNLENKLIFQRRCSKLNSSVAISTSLTVLEPLFAVEEYPKVRAFFDQVAIVSSEEVVLTRGLAGEEESGVRGE